jgi:hypothetical protein
MILTGIILMGTTIRLTIQIMADFSDGVWIRHGRTINGIAFRITINKMDWDIIAKGQSNGFDLAVSRFY